MALLASLAIVAAGVFSGAVARRLGIDTRARTAWDHGSTGLGIALLLGFLWLMVRRMGYVGLSRWSALRASILRMAADIALGRGLSGGLVIVRCQETQWQEAVGALLRVADVVVVDVTEMTAPLRFELGLIPRYLPPERLVRLCRGSQPPPLDALEGLLPERYRAPDQLVAIDATRPREGLHRLEAALRRSATCGTWATRYKARAMAVGLLRLQARRGRLACALVVAALPALAVGRFEAWPELVGLGGLLLGAALPLAAVATIQGAASARLAILAPALAILSILATAALGA